jgi:hypothetical protein
MTYGGGDSGWAATSARSLALAPRPESFRGEVCPQVGDTGQAVSPQFRTRKHQLGSPVSRPPV